MIRSWSIGVVALALLSGTTAYASVTGEACVAPPVSKNLPFTVGEKMEYELDSLGATVGNFSLSFAPAPRPNTYAILARGKTGNVAASFYSVDATAEAYLTRGLEPRRYVEDAQEGNIKRSVDLAFPPGKDQKLNVHGSRQGTREEFSVQAPPDSRDMLSALYAVRAMPLSDNAAICIPIYGARKIWTLRIKVAGKETLRTPVGEFKTIHLTGTAVRSDAPQQPREVHFWYSDDTLRIPVAAMGIYQSKPLRATLVQYTQGRKPTTHGDRPLPR